MNVVSTGRRTCRRSRGFAINGVCVLTDERQLRLDGRKVIVREGRFAS